MHPFQSIQTNSDSFALKLSHRKWSLNVFYGPKNNIDNSRQIKKNRKPEETQKNQMK